VDETIPNAFPPTGDERAKDYLILKTPQKLAISQKTAYAENCDDGK